MQAKNSLFVYCVYVPFLFKVMDGYVLVNMSFICKPVCLCTRRMEHNVVLLCNV